jgi:hypothetical protein
MITHRSPLVECAATAAVVKVGISDMAKYGKMEGKIELEGMGQLANPANELLLISMLIILFLQSLGTYKSNFQNFHDPDQDPFVSGFS